MTYQKANQSGFTLVEVLVVMTILVAITSLAMPRLADIANKKLAKQTIVEINQIIDAAQNYQFEHYAWPDETSNCANLIQVLLDNSFLAHLDRKNPWGQDYSFACEPKKLTINSRSDSSDWAMTIAAALPSTLAIGQRTETLIPRAGAIPGIINKLDKTGTDGGMQAVLNMNQHSIENVDNIQVAKINNVAVEQLGVPKKMVAFFLGRHAYDCPAGWYPHFAMRGRTPVGAGYYFEQDKKRNRYFAKYYGVGTTGGKASLTLDISQMPKHSHPNNEIHARGPRPPWPKRFYSTIHRATRHLPTVIWTQPAGGDQPFDNRMPYMALTACYKS